MLMISLTKYIKKENHNLRRNFLIGFNTWYIHHLSIPLTRLNFFEFYYITEGTL
jgi:hypothetical protein